MLDSPRREVLERLADQVVPGDAEAAAPSAIGVADFFIALFEGDRAAERDQLVAFLDRNRAADPDEVAEDPWFREFAETVHEHYWTSPTGLLAVGFAPSIADQIEPD
ncbi:MAG: hypothetical protein ACKO5K_04390 [Armatimonadota bacterium]